MSACRLQVQWWWPRGQKWRWAWGNASGHDPRATFRDLKVSIDLVTRHKASEKARGSRFKTKRPTFTGTSQIRAHEHKLHRHGQTPSNSQVEPVASLWSLRVEQPDIWFLRSFHLSSKMSKSMLVCGVLQRGEGWWWWVFIRKETTSTRSIYNGKFGKNHSPSFPYSYFLWYVLAKEIYQLYNYHLCFVYLSMVWKCLQLH